MSQEQRALSDEEKTRRRRIEKSSIERGKIEMPRQRGRTRENARVRKRLDRRVARVARWIRGKESRAGDEKEYKGDKLIEQARSSRKEDNELEESRER
jgi:hypothetical protein